MILCHLIHAPGKLAFSLVLLGEAAHLPRQVPTGLRGKEAPESSHTRPLHCFRVPFCSMVDTVPLVSSRSHSRCSRNINCPDPPSPGRGDVRDRGLVLLPLHVNGTKGMKRKGTNDNHKPSSTTLKCSATIFQKSTLLRYYSCISRICGEPSHTTYRASSSLSSKEKLPSHTHTPTRSNTQIHTHRHAHQSVHPGAQICVCKTCRHAH